MTIPNITALPTPVPSRADPTNFATRADAFLGALPTFGIELNTFATEANALAIDVQDNKDASDQTLLDMQALETTMGNIYNNSVATSNFKGLWSSLTGALNKPASVYHNSHYWILLNNLTDVTTSIPSDSNSDWLRSANTALYTTYNDLLTLLGSSTVQGAIEKLKERTETNRNYNLLLNPEFQVNQQYSVGSTITIPVSTIDVYVSDQWQVYTNAGNMTAVVNTIPTTGRNELTLNGVGSYPSGLTVFRQFIESVNIQGLSGDFIVKLKVRPNSTFNKPVLFEVSTPFVKDDFGSGTTTLYNQNFTMNNEAKEYTFSFSLTSPASKGMTVRFVFQDFKSNDSLIIERVTLTNTNNTSLPFIPRPYQQELAMCQRYWENGIIGFNGAYQQGGSGYTPYANFVVAKRVTPTMTLSNVTSSNLTGFSVTALSPNSFRYGGTAVSTGPVVARADYVASARL